MQDTHRNPVLAALLTIAAVALLIGFSESQVRKWTYRQRKLPRGWPAPVRVADSVRYRRVDIERWLDELAEPLPIEATVVTESVETPSPKPTRKRGRPPKLQHEGGAHSGCA